MQSSHRLWMCKGPLSNPLLSVDPPGADVMPIGPWVVSMQVVDFHVEPAVVAERHPPNRLAQGLCA